MAESDQYSNGDAPRRRITVITCAFNEQDCIEELARRLFAVFDGLPQYEFEVLAIENGSHDDTLAAMQAVRERDERFRVVQLSRNFGLDGGLTAGIDMADGDAIVLMAADLQDPPEVIPEFISMWEQGYFNVYGIVATRHATGRLRQLNSALFYWLIGKLSEHPLPRNARDFRLLDRQVYEAIRQIREPHPFHRGLAAWTGFSSIGVEFDQPPRYAGETKASSRGMSEFAVRSIFSQSMTPLRIMPMLGMTLIAIAVCALIGLSVNALVNGVPFPGFGTIVAVIIMMSGVLFLFLSVIGIYVGLIYEQVRTRPNYVVHQEWGIGRDRFPVSGHETHGAASPNAIQESFSESESTPRPGNRPRQRESTE